MRRSVAGVVVLGAMLLPASAWADATAPSPARGAAVLAAKIDDHVGARWKAKKVKPAALADDAEFLRRVYLDLIGRIPDLLEARDFLDDKSKDKRAKLVEKLLKNERYARHFANVWRSWLIPGADDPNLQYLRPQMEAWLLNELKSDHSYDKVVRALLTNGGTRTPYEGLGGFRGGRGGYYVQPSAFYQANGNKPETVAAAASRLFLGMKLECAQCHNHPFAKHSRKQFWEFAAFFANINTGYGRELILRGGGLEPAKPVTPTFVKEIEIPGTGKKAQAKFLDGKEPTFKDGVDPRVTLSEWMTSPENPYFAKAAVNRLWEHFLGTGLVDPIDEAHADNAPSHPELLNELAKQFAAHKFDLKFLIRAIVLSQAYQLTSKQDDASQADARLFARQRIRGLTPEQLYDSLALATGKEETLSAPAYAGGGYMDPARAEFLRRFPNQDKRTDQQTSILQALYLMNGKLVGDATSLDTNPNLDILARGKTIKTSRRLEQLYLLTLGRRPSAAESERLVKYLDKGGPSGDQGQALCDVFWALLNSSEFCVNH